MPLSSRVSFISSGERFVRATPLCLLPGDPKEPAVSTYMRSAVPAVGAAAASVTVTPPDLNEKIVNALGAALPGSGSIRIEPDSNPEFAPEIAVLKELRFGIE